MSWTSWFRRRRTAKKPGNARSHYRRSQAAPRRLAAGEGLERRELLTITVEFQTVLGNFQVGLSDTVAPVTVSNFLNYVTSNRYDGSFFHRQADNSPTEKFVIQGGGFTFNPTSGQAVNVMTDPPIVNEFNVSNTRGTIAMAKLGGNPDSATSQFFFNLSNNGSNLDNQNGGFTVFGTVLGDGMTVVDALSSTPKFNFGGTFSELPLRNYTSGNNVTADNLLFINDIVLVGPANPIVLPTADLSTTNADVLNVPITARDYNGAGTTLTYSLDAGAPTGATIDPQTGLFSWQPSAADVGKQFSVTVRASNNLGTPLSDTDTFVITVTQAGVTPAPGTPDLNAASDTGRLTDDNLTNLDNGGANRTLSFTVPNTVSGATVGIFANGELIGTATAGASGTTVVTTAGNLLLPDGVYQFTAAQKRPDELQSPDSAALNVTIDTTAPLVPGQFDLSFGDGGVAEAGAQGDQAARAGLLLPDGKYLVVGRNGTSPNRDFVLARYLANGQLDTSFNTTGLFFSGFSSPPPENLPQDDVAFAAAVQADGKYVVAGMSGNNLLVARYLTNGLTDTTFAGGGGALNGALGATNRPSSVSILPDGKILVALTVDGDFALLRLTADGAVDTTFATEGTLTTNFGGSEEVTAMQLLPGGKILLAGHSGDSLALAQYNSDGTPDLAFDIDGKLLITLPVATSRADVVRLADGKLLILAGQAGGGTLLRLAENGQADSTFDGDGQLPLSQLGLAFSAPARLGVSAAGEIFVGGTFNSDFRLARLTSSGQLDSRFGSLGTVTADIGLAQDDGDQVADLVVSAAGVPTLVGTTGGGASGSNLVLARFVGGSGIGLALDALSDTGVSNSDRITRDATPTFLVDAGGQRYAIFRGNTPLDPVFQSEPTFTAEAQPEGTASYTVSLVDDAGNLSISSQPLTVTFDYTAPRVTAVHVSSSTGTQAGFDITVGSGEQLRTVPVASVDRLRFQFSEQVAADDADLTLSGQRQASYAAGTVAGAAGPTGWQATWSLPVVPTADQLVLHLAGTGGSPITDLAGNALDGEWDNPTNLADASSDTFPSGNNAAGGDFSFAITVLTGDANRDLRVDSLDQAIWQANQGAANPTFAMGDFNGDGQVNQADETLRASFQGINLDVQTPGSISGVISNDVDRDGQLDPTDEPLAGFLVFVDLNGNGQLDQGEPNQLTGLDGSFSFTDLLPLSYNVQVQLPEGWTPTQGQSNQSTVQVQAGSTANVSFAAISPSTAPAAPDLLAASDSGQLNNDNITNFNGRDAGHALQFSVTGTIVGATVQILIDGQVAAEAVATSDTTTLTTNTPVPIPDGTHAITARQAASGESFSDPSSALSITIDTIAPLPQVSGGVLDPSFSGDGRLIQSLSAAAERAAGMVVQPDGKIVVAATLTTGEAASSFVVYRFLADGTLDPGFGTGGVVTTVFDLSLNEARALALAPDGKIVVAGMTKTDPLSFVAVARYNPDGTLDNSFDTDGKRTFPLENRGAGARAVKVMSDQRIVVVGDFVRNSQSDFGVVRLLENGALDTTFGTDGQVSLETTQQEVAADVEVLSDGKVLVTGIQVSGTQGDPNRLALYRFLANGDLDNSFGTGGQVFRSVGVAGTPSAMAVDSAGRILVGGIISDGVNGSFALFRFLSDGQVDQGFGILGVRSTAFDGGQAVIRDLALLGDGRIVAVGSTGSASAGQVALARYLADGRLDESFGNAGTHTVSFGTAVDQGGSIALDPMGRLVVAGTAGETAGSSPKVGLARLLDPLDPAPLLTAESDTGISSSDRITNDNFPDFALTTGGPFFRFFRDGAQISVDYASGAVYTANSQLEGTFAYQVRPIDLAGNAGALSAATTVTFDLTAPTVAVDPVAPDPRSTPLSSAQIHFSEPVLGFDASGLELTRDGGPNLIGAGQMLTSGNQRDFALGGLTLSTAQSGDYQIRVLNSTGVTDAAGNALAVEAVENFTVEGLTTLDQGVLGLAVLSDQGPSAAGTYYALTTVRAGLLSIEAEFSAAGGDVVLELFDAQFQSLGTSSATQDGRQRIDRTVDPGQVFFVRRLGSNPSATIRMGNVYTASGNQHSLFGTDEANAFSFDAGAAASVSVDGLAYSFDPGSGAVITIMAGAGTDTLNALGTAAPEQAELGPGSGYLKGTGYRLNWQQLENATLDAGGGLDQVKVSDSDGDDQGLFMVADLLMNGTNYAMRARNFELVEVRAGQGNDAIILTGSSQADQLTVRPSNATLAGAGYVHRAIGFETLAADGGGGVDSAYLFDTAGDDELMLGADTTVLLSPQGSYSVESFEQVRATATTGYDRVVMDGTEADDMFVGQANQSQISGGNLMRVARGFDEVRSAGAQGADQAVMMRRLPSDSITAAGGAITLAGADYYVRVTGYEEILTPPPEGSPASASTVFALPPSDATATTGAFSNPTTSVEALSHDTQMRLAAFLAWLEQRHHSDAPQAAQTEEATFDLVHAEGLDWLFA